jgi:hypothetical protein
MKKLVLIPFLISACSTTPIPNDRKAPPDKIQQAISRCKIEISTNIANKEQKEDVCKEKYNTHGMYALTCAYHYIDKNLKNNDNYFILSTILNGSVIPSCALRETPIGFPKYEKPFHLLSIEEKMKYPALDIKKHFVGTIVP